MLSDGFAHGFEQAIVSEPAISHDQQEGLGKSIGYFREHLNGLLELGLEGEHFVVDRNVAGIDSFLHMVKAKGQGQASPATFDDFQQADGYDVLRPGIFRLIDLSGVIEKGGAAEDLFAGFWIDVIIQRQQHSPIHGRLWNERP